MTRQTLHDELLKRLKEKRRFLQVLAGPRQVGKTTLARQVIKSSKLPAHYASADEPSLRDRTWIEQQWDAARFDPQWKSYFVERAFHKKFGIHRQEAGIKPS